MNLMVASLKGFLSPPCACGTTTSGSGNQPQIGSDPLHWTRRNRFLPLFASSPVWESYVSTHPSAYSALEKVLQDCRADEAEIDAAFLFVGPSHAADFDGLVAEASTWFPNLLSVVGGGTIGAGLEMDESSQPSLSLLVGKWPDGTKVDYFSFNELDDPIPKASDSFWVQASSYFVVSDPWFSQLQDFTQRLSDAVVTGGISVPSGTGPTVGLRGKAFSQGSLVGLRFLHGSTSGLQAVVAQGCRGVGRVMTVTACESNIVTEMDGEGAIYQLEKLIQNAQGETEKRQISSGLVIGLATDPTETPPKDYLIRQIAGFVPQKGGIVISGAQLHEGDKLCFHVRDKKAAEEDFGLMTKRAQAARLFSEVRASPFAALQVSCVARGRYLYGIPNVDLQYSVDLCPNPGSIAGFYANGELGPVGLGGFSDGKEQYSYVHGFTTVCALLCEFSSSQPTEAKENAEKVDKSWE